MMRSTSYVNFHRYGTNECETLVLTCIDFRFSKNIADTLTYAGYRDFDFLAMPGGSKSVLDEVSRQVVFRALDIVIPIHKVKRVIIVDHIDCQAHGGSQRFTTEDEEEEYHGQVLKQAEDIIREKYPELEISSLYVDWNRFTPVESG